MAPSLDDNNNNNNKIIEDEMTHLKSRVTVENVKYLPGIKLGKNVVANPDLENAVKDANLLVFVTPHQFMEGICKRLAGKIRSDAEAISLIKGMEVKREGPCMISSLISEKLGVDCCVLMGANIANEIALEKFSEATVGYRKNKEIAEKWVQLFNTSYFMVSAAAIMRIGLREMKAFSKLLFPSVKDTTFFESCGIADLITTCLGEETGNVPRHLLGMVGRGLLTSSEAEMLQGQKLQVGFAYTGCINCKRGLRSFEPSRMVRALPPLSQQCMRSALAAPPTAIVEFSELTPKNSPYLRVYTIFLKF
ncbi:hypothetical protein DH2020_012763 [Rehmannia glutinosa]|uniref:Glycerol-3-phosphate dehydrogenase [NAD(+)] n=1 Tax=Rehmannia glutinosa TaxID=99300 RepID=A0ABR0X3R2_REHGL